MLKQKFIFGALILLVTYLAEAASVGVPTATQAQVTAAMDKYNALKKANPLDSYSDELQYARYLSLLYNNSLLAKNGGSQTDVDRKNLEAAVQYYRQLCDNSVSTNACIKLAQLDSLRQRKYDSSDFDEYATTAYPKIDPNNYSFSSDGVITSPTSKASESSCVWEDSPRNLIDSPTCSGRSQLCSGYITCVKNGSLITRLATCGAENCKSNRADDCAKQKGYGSMSASSSGYSNPSYNSSPANGVKGAK